MSLKPWHTVVTPRSDLLRGEPLDESQFAVHLDQVAAGIGPPEYVNPELFLARTFITDGLQRFAAEVLRRLAGQRQAANAVLNLTTQFGGGKTHALTLLYHLTRLGPRANGLQGIAPLLRRARLTDIPKASVAVFVGSAWDAVEGRVGPDGTRRLTPWGDLAWQLSEQTGDPSLFAAIREQDLARVRPGKDVIRKILPSDQPVLILMDEVMNFMTAARAIAVGDSTLASQFYEFVHSLTEVADSCEGLAVVLSLPKSEEEMSADDEQDYRRLSKVTSRVATAYVLARDLEVPEIVRRRLFDSIGDDRDVKACARAQARWVADHRDQLPRWFPVDDAEKAFEASYPFHPAVLSVFERKWQALPSFQRTRGVLKLLAQWVGDAYQHGVSGDRSDALIALGTAPLDDQFFRTATLDQLGNDRLAPAVISDIAGAQAHAVRLDAEASEPIRRLLIHRKVATAIFFESSGGQVREEATVPELRLAVGGPDIDVGNVETALEALQKNCYYLLWAGNSYRFSTKPNVNKLLPDRRSSLESASVIEQAQAAVRKVFAPGRETTNFAEPIFFPNDTAAVPDTPVLRLVVPSPSGGPTGDPLDFATKATQDRGDSPRIYRNGLIWGLPGDSTQLMDAARQTLAWRTISEEAPTLDLEDGQRDQLRDQLARAERTLLEVVWQTYRRLAFLGRDGSLRAEDLGLIEPSAGLSMQQIIDQRLKELDELTDTLAPSRVVQNWPSEEMEWTTRALRDAVYISPAFTRLQTPDALRITIATGVEHGDFGYAAKRAEEFVDIKYGEPLSAASVEFSEDIVLVTKTLALQLKEAAPSPEAPVTTVPRAPEPALSAEPLPRSSMPPGKTVAGLRWEGDVPAQKWTSLFMRVLTGLQARDGLRLHLVVESKPESGLGVEQVERVKSALHELELPNDVVVLSDSDANHDD